jgi:UDPglucose 6-dehydrogenase
MKITVIGAGYVGLVCSACLSEKGNHVVCHDIDSALVNEIQRGALSIYEPGLHDLLRSNLQSQRLEFTSSIDQAVSHSDVIFLAVPTPSSDDGSADLQHIFSISRAIGRLMTVHKVIVSKSTVPVGTNGLIRSVVQSELELRKSKLLFSVVSNPEFLSEGGAIKNFMHPDRIILGVTQGDEVAEKLMRAIYASFVHTRNKLVVMSPNSAELTKYAANAMLATRISFMNEMAALAERIGADIDDVRIGIGSDRRIGNQFLFAGAGYGGSCFSKDLKAIIHSASMLNLPSRILVAVEAVNDSQRQVLARKVISVYGDDLSGKCFALWGLSFKPDTDDMREAPSRQLIADLLRRGGRIQAYDPKAATSARRQLLEDLGEAALLEGFTLVASASEALNGADALIVVTEWKEFRKPNFRVMAAELRDRRVFDGRNIYNPRVMRSFGLRYHGIGRE